MDTGFAAAAAAMEKALRRLDAALLARAAVFRSLADQHGQATLELRQAREALQAAQQEAEMLRERASLVDALRSELAALQAERDGLAVALAAAQAAASPPPPVSAPAVASSAEVEGLRRQLQEARSFEAQMMQRIEAMIARLRGAMAAPEA